MKTKTIILALILVVAHFAFADEHVVTRVSDSKVSITETESKTVEVNIDDLVRQLKNRYEQKAKEIADRDAEIADLESKIAKAKAAGVDPSPAVALIEAEIAAEKAEAAK